MAETGPAELERPEPAHHSRSENASAGAIQPARSRKLEATELGNMEQELCPQESIVERQEEQDGSRPSRLRRLVTPVTRAGDGPLKKFWRRQIRVSVPHEDCRDHFACERTFLGYVRTAVMLAQVGITIAQLFRLQNDHGTKHLTYYRMGGPLAGLFIASAMLVTLTGAFRFWRLQNAIVRGKSRAGGWELHFITFLITALLLVTFAGLLLVQNPKETHDNETNAINSSHSDL